MDSHFWSTVTDVATWKPQSNGEIFHCFLRHSLFGLFLSNPVLRKTGWAVGWEWPSVHISSVTPQHVLLDNPQTSAKSSSLSNFSKLLHLPGGASRYVAGVERRTDPDKDCLTSGMFSESWFLKLHSKWQGAKPSETATRKLLIGTFLKHNVPGKISLNIRLKHRTFLVAQWLRIHLQMQGTQVREDPTCHRATKPASHNYWAHVPQLLKPEHLEPVARNKRSHQNEKPAHRNEE